MRVQPYLWPLIAHVIAMSTVVWNPLLFFWLTRKQKRSHLGGILHTSEIITSLASRVHSLRSTSGESTKRYYLASDHKNSIFFRIQRRKTNHGPHGNSGALSSSHSPATSAVNRPLIVSNARNGHSKHVLQKANSIHTNML